MDKERLLRFNIRPKGSDAAQYEASYGVVINEIGLIREAAGVSDEEIYTDTREFPIDDVPHKVTLWSSANITSWRVDVLPEGATEPEVYSYNQSEGMVLQIPQGEDVGSDRFRVTRDSTGAGILGDLEQVLFLFNEAESPN